MQIFQINVCQHPSNVHIFWSKNSLSGIHPINLILQKFGGKFTYIDVLQLWQYTSHLPITGKKYA